MTARFARLACAVALCTALPARADEDGGVPAARETAVEIEVGETVSLGVAMGTPVTCDDGSLVERTTRGSSLALKGLKPGTTLCSLLTAAFTSLRYRVRVVEPPPAPRK